MTWENGAPVALDLYYDPVVDEHVGRSVGIVPPAWYFAPQRPEVAAVGWQTAAAAAGLLGDAEITGLENTPVTVTLLQIAGEYADAGTKARLWAAADPFVEPQWDRQRGEFTLGFRLDEAHPRGQWNARAMAGWVAQPGAWSRIFNAPNLAKFAAPTIVGVDFPNVALSEARWDGTAMHLAAHPMNDAFAGRATRVRMINVDSADGWVQVGADGVAVPLAGHGDHVEVTLTADNRAVEVRRA